MFGLSGCQYGHTGSIERVVGNVLLAVKKLTEVLDPVLEELSCPQLMKYDASSFDKFPGAQGGI